MLNWAKHLVFPVVYIFRYISMKKKETDVNESTKPWHLILHDTHGTKLKHSVDRWDKRHVTSNLKPRVCCKTWWRSHHFIGFHLMDTFLTKYFLNPGVSEWLTVQKMSNTHLFWHCGRRGRQRSSTESKLQQHRTARKELWPAKTLTSKTHYGHTQQRSM